MSVNARLRPSDPPGDWVTETECTVCGERYDAVRLLRDPFAEGAQLVRQANGEQGGFRTRGPVLWAARCLKFDAWFFRHAQCGRKQ